MATCTHETSYTDFDGSAQSFPCTDTATWIAWIPQQDGYDPATGTTVPVCGDHVIVLTTEIPDAEIVAISDLPMTCSACHEPVWASHPEGHSTGQRCDLCQEPEAEHPACSCPNLDAYLAAMSSDEVSA